MELRGENNGIYTSRNSLRLFNTFILTMAVIIYTSRNSLRLFNLRHLLSTSESTLVEIL